MARSSCCVSAALFFLSSVIFLYLLLFPSVFHPSCDYVLAYDSNVFPVDPYEYMEYVPQGRTFCWYDREFPVYYIYVGSVRYPLVPATFYGSPLCYCEVNGSVYMAPCSTPLDFNRFVNGFCEVST